MNIAIKGINLTHLIIFSTIIGIACALGQLPGGMPGGFAITMSMGFLFEYLGEKTPIVNEYLGGGPIFCIFISATLVYTQIMPTEVVNVINGFMKQANFLDFYITALICGSILGMQASLLVKAGVRFAIPILCGLIVASLFVAFVGLVIGYGWNTAVGFICFPIMGGGLGAGVLPMTEIIQANVDMDTKTILAMLLPPMAIGNVLSIICAGFLDKLGKRFPSLTGNGKLMVSQEEELKEDKKLTFSFEALGIGLLVSCTMIVLSKILALVIPLHSYALLIISVALIKVAGIVPQYIQDACSMWFQFVAKYMTAALLIGIGVTYTDLGAVINAFSIETFVMVLAVVLGSIVGAGLGGKLVGFHFIESALAAGLCMANMGGTGDVAVLSAARRFELMPFAQISSRLGGALVLIVVGIAIPFLY